MINYKLVINLKGLNFVERSFANICFEKDAKVKGVVHELTETGLARIVTSEGETYKLVEAPVTLRNKTVIAKHYGARRIQRRKFPYQSVT